MSGFLNVRGHTPETQAAWRVGRVGDRRSTGLGAVIGLVLLCDCVAIVEDEHERRWEGDREVERWSGVILCMMWEEAQGDNSRWSTYLSKCLSGSWIFFLQTGSIAFRRSTCEI